MCARKNKHLPKPSTELGKKKTCHSFSSKFKTWTSISRVMLSNLVRKLAFPRGLQPTLRRFSGFHLEDEVVSHRLEKLSVLKQSPKKHLLRKFPISHKVEDVLAKCEELEAKEERAEVVQVAGRVMGKRSFGKLSFFVLLDEGHKIQLYVSKKDMVEDGDFDVCLAFGLFFPFFALSGIPQPRRCRRYRGSERHA